MLEPKRCLLQYVSALSFWESAKGEARALGPCFRGESALRRSSARCTEVTGRITAEAAFALCLSFNLPSSGSRPESGLTAEAA